MELIKTKAIFMCYLIITAIFMISSAISAEARADACCEKTTEGDYCKDTALRNCDQNYNFAPSVTCENTQFCKVGCCVNEKEGLCYPNVGAAKCDSKGGTFYVGNPSCGIEQCKVGCCHLGNQCFLATEKRCKIEAEKYPDLNKNNIFDKSINTRKDCIDICHQQDEGCCVSGESCVYTTKGQCAGDFHKDTFCSDYSLDCGCKSKYEKKCIEGEDDVYWFDSCGNREGLAEDCNFLKGTMCGLINGEYRCKNTNCEDTADFPSNVHDPRMGGKRYNGESWCVYESGVGDYFDRPGSRHYKHICINGEEIVESCREFRDEICLQANIEKDGKTVSNAQCLDNEIYNSNIKENVSTVPRGFAFWKSSIGSDNVPQREGAEICEKANVKCTVYYVKKNRFASWKVKNEICQTQKYIDDVAKYCKSMGDCGADLNILGERAEDGFVVKWSGTSKGPRPDRVSEEAWNNWSTFGVFGGIKYLEDAFKIATKSIGLDSTGDMLTTTTIAVGGAVAAILLSGYIGVGFPGIASALGSIGLSGTVGVGEAATAAGTGPVGAGAGVVAIVAGIYKVITGIINGDVGGTAGGAVMIMGGVLLLIPGVGWFVGVVVIAISVLIELIIGGAKVKKKYLEIECFPWVPPPGGEDCEKCDDDPFKPCTEERCRSLGAACELINQDVGDPNDYKCVETNPNDVSSPAISIWEDVLTKGFTANPTPDGYLIQPKVPAFTTITFGIKTDEAAQCKIDNKHTAKYDEMSGGFFGGPLYTIEKKMSLNLPSGKDYTYYVRCRDFHGNENVKEYYIQFSVSDEPDMTPPIIEKTSINNGAYVPAGIEKTDITLFLNEPSNCKWSNQDQAMDEMPSGNIFVCDDEPMANVTFYTDYECDGELTGIKDNQENTFYFRCKDIQRNEQGECEEFVLKGTTSLNIDSVSPSGDLYIVSPEMKVLTSGGAEQGKSICTYKKGVFTAIPFFNTDSNEHSQQLTNLTMGDYLYKINCMDIAGNEARDVIDFSIKVDDDPPLIANIYSRGNTLYLVTDEESTCAYSNKVEQFEKDEGTLMQGIDVKEHSTQISNKIYHIICWDEYDNKMGRVTVYT